MWLWRLVWIALGLAIAAPVGLLLFGHNVEFFRVLCWISLVMFAAWVLASIIGRFGELWPGFTSYGLALVISASMVGGLMEGEQRETRTLAGLGLWFLVLGPIYGAIKWVVLRVTGRSGKSSPDQYIDRSASRFQQAVNIDDHLDRLITFDKLDQKKARHLHRDIQIIVRDQENDPLPIQMQIAQGIAYRDNYLLALRIIRDKAQDVIETGGANAPYFDGQLNAWGEATERSATELLAESDGFRRQLGMSPRAR
jgi:hypothetical protein